MLEFGKLAAYKYGGFTFNNIPFTDGKAISEVIPNLLLLQSWLPFADHLSFNFPSWSISIEFYLYALLFLSVVIFSKFKEIIWVSILVITFYLMVSESEVVLNTVLRGLSCFFGGAVTYLIYKKISHIKIKKPLGSIIEMAIILMVIAVVKSEFKYQNITATIIFYIVILVFSFESGIISNVLKLKIFQEIGKLSYSIYMTHAAVLFILTSVMIIVQKIIGIELAPMLNGIRYLTSGNEIINNFIVLFIISIVIVMSQLKYQGVSQLDIKSYQGVSQ